MQFKSITLALAGATTLMAHPSAERFERDLVEIDRKPAADGVGTLVFLGDGSSRKRAEAAAGVVEERSSCQNNPQPKCSTHHTARNELCDKLVTELFADPSISVGEDPRRICYEGDAAESNEYCCVAWHKTIPHLTKGDLAPIAQTMLQQCTAEGISGKTYSVWVHDTCTDVCLSNRGKGC
ncbi:hypothetical protein GGR52DRAFT_573960 [Hypoxylon sp. FL1284]|nr:hypothetical protein GGR52DRAFT_573960 [Hypoxylon sp. FL1284]